MTVLAALRRLSVMCAGFNLRSLCVSDSGSVFTCRSAASIRRVALNPLPPTAVSPSRTAPTGLSRDPKTSLRCCERICVIISPVFNTCPHTAARRRPSSSAARWRSSKPTSTAASKKCSSTHSSALITWRSCRCASSRWASAHGPVSSITELNAQYTIMYLVHTRHIYIYIYIYIYRKYPKLRIKFLHHRASKMCSGLKIVGAFSILAWQACMQWPQKAIINYCINAKTPVFSCSSCVLCFQSTQYYDMRWSCEHLIMVWINAFVMLMSQLLPPGYCDLLHRSAAHLGRWQRLEPGSYSNAPQHMWGILLL